MESQHITETQNRIQQLEEAMEQIYIVKKYLKHNSTEVKSQITSGISRQLETLRNREMWLLDQVEIIQQSKEEVLQKQLHRMYHLLGSLQTALENLENTPQGCLDERLSDILERLDKFNLKPEETPHIAFSADVGILREAIRNFGSVDTERLNLETAFVDAQCSSASLPRAFEDYEDLEHHVLYKTLDDVNKEKNKDSSISVKVPKLQHPQWLSYTPTTNMPTTATPNSPRKDVSSFASQTGGELGTLFSTGCGLATYSIQDWLHQIKQEIEIEEDNEDFELLSLPQTCDLSETSGGNEVLASRMASDPTQHKFLYFHQVKSAPTDEWLTQSNQTAYQPFEWLEFEPFSSTLDWRIWLASNKQEESSSKTICCRGQCIPTEVPMSVDIENLDLIACVEPDNKNTSTYIPYKKDDDSEKEIDELEQVQEVCMANELCKSFSECICNDECTQKLRQQMEKKQEMSPSSEQLQTPLTTDKSEHILCGDTEQDGASFWLSKVNSITDDLPGDLFPVFHDHTMSDPSEWLEKPTPDIDTQTSTDHNASQQPAPQINSHKWLRPDQPGSVTWAPSEHLDKFKFDQCTKSWLSQITGCCVKSSDIFQFLPSVEADSIAHWLKQYTSQENEIKWENITNFQQDCKNNMINSDSEANSGLECAMFTNDQETKEWLKPFCDTPKMYIRNLDIEEKFGINSEPSMKENINGNKRIWLKQEELEPEEDVEDDSVWLTRKENANLYSIHDPREVCSPKYFHDKGSDSQWLLKAE